MRSRLLLAVAVLAAALPVARIEAQVVQVVVRSEASGGPVVGAVVTLLRGEVPIAEGLTGADGARTLATPGPGEYRVRVRRIGFAPHLTEPFTVGRGEARVVPVTAPERRAELPAVIVEARRKQCGRGDRRSVQAAALWEQIATALTASEISLADTLVRTQVRVYQSALDARGNLLEIEGRDLGRGGARPFTTPPPAELSRAGYVITDSAGDLLYFAPDARVLLSPEFEADHCFDVVQGRGDRAGLIGLQFEPVQDRRVADVRGTLWVAPATSELQSLEFAYTNVRTPVAARLSGGRLHFERLPSGAWLVRSWAITMPRFGRSVRGGVILVGYAEAGGHADPAADLNVRGLLQVAAGARTDTSADHGSITGVVVDSLLGRGLEGATVTADAGRRRTTTDSLGEFTLDSVPAGVHVVRFSHPELDAIGVRDPGIQIEVDSGFTMQVRLATPSLQTLKRGACDDAAALLSATVRDAATGDPIPGASVVVRWLDVGQTPDGRFTVDRPERAADTGDSGTVLACLPPRTDASALASAGPFTSGAVDVRVDARRFAVLELLVDRDSTRLLPDGTLRSSGGATFEARITDIEGRPVQGALLAFDDIAAEGESDAAGRVVLRNIPAGSQTFEVRRIGFARVRRAVGLRRGDMQPVAVTLQPVTELAAVTVRAEADRGHLRREFDQRRRQGGGWAFGPAELATRQNQSVPAILRTLPSLRVEVLGPMQREEANGYPVRSGDLVIRLPAPHGYCHANVWIDDHPSSAAELTALPMKAIAAIEVYPRPAAAPVKYIHTNGCGAVLVWTRGVGWAG